jgi:hypothetical protein
LWQVSWLIPAAAAAISSTIWEQLPCTNIATSWILNSVLTGMLIIFQTLCPIYKTFVPLKHSAMAECFFAVCLLDHMKRFASGFA